MFVSQRMWIRDIEKLTEKIEPLVKENSCFLAPMKGGLAIGQILAYRFDKPLNIYIPNSRNVFPSISSKHIIFVDDLTDTGKTLTRFLNDSQFKSYEKNSATVYVKKVFERKIEPDIFIKLTGPEWITFWYDKK